MSPFSFAAHDRKSDRREGHKRDFRSFGFSCPVSTELLHQNFGQICETALQDLSLALVLTRSACFLVNSRLVVVN